MYKVFLPLAQSPFSALISPSSQNVGSSFGSKHQESLAILHHAQGVSFSPNWVTQTLQANPEQFRNK
ncbi:hypothetical protein HMI54_011670 [Coelomomyces lativittatus]|nr:hypothetical protein HMI54_011670 [Coelomomyces lativittatus]